LYTPSTIGVDAFGRTMGMNRELLQALHKRGITLSMPVDGVQALKGGQAAIAFGTFTSKYVDPNVPPGQGNWVQVFERDGNDWKIRVAASSRSALAAAIK
jgi:hypothetical protein